MTFWLPELTGRSGPRYIAIVDAIADAIESGELKSGTRLPAQRELAYNLGLTVGTVTRAYNLAQRRGLISGSVGRGTFVLEQKKAASAFNFAAIEKTRVDMTCYRPVFEGNASAGAIANGLATLSRRPQLVTLLHRYPPGPGYLTHRVAGAAWIGRAGVTVPPEQVIVCGGGQQAIATILSSLVPPGGTVATENLTYSGFKELSHLFRLRLTAVAQDDQGMVPQSLAEVASGGGVKLVFLQPTLHNPVATTMSAQRRQELVEVARRFDLLLIEDDVCGAVLETRPTPLAALAPERTFYITSTSKCLSPALRIGYLACPPNHFAQVAAAFHTLTLSVTPLIAEMVTQFIGDGTADRLIVEQREELRARQRIAGELLGGLVVATHPEGIYLWLELPQPWRADDFRVATRHRGVAVVPSENFIVGRSSAPHAVRVSVSSAPNRDELKRGLSTIAELLSSQPPPRGSVMY